MVKIQVDSQGKAYLTNSGKALIASDGGYSEIPSYQVSNGVISRRIGTLTGNEFSGITSVGNYGLYHAFYGCTGLTGTIDLSSLTTVGQNGLGGAFYGCTGLTGTIDLSSLTNISSVNSSPFQEAFRECTGLTSVDLSSLTTVLGGNAMQRAFLDCTGITSIDLSALTSIGSYSLDSAFRNTRVINVSLTLLETISTNGAASMFRDCINLTTVNFTSLKSINNYGLSGAFSGCASLENVYFNALTTTSFGSFVSQFVSMMQNTGTTTTHTLHFPSNMESTISGLQGYPLFGGTSGYVVLSFDLPATS